MARAILCSAVTVVAWTVPRRPVWRAGASAGLWTAAANSASHRSIGRVSIHCCASGSKRPLSSRSRDRLNLLDQIELTFLGTSSAAPTRTRNQQALAMQLGGETWLFDCGEATQHRMMLTTLSPPAIKRIFVSHLHGDHCFGLPGLLCNMAIAYGGGEGDGPATTDAADSTPVTIVGPQGLRSWLRAVLGNSYATLGKMKLEVHELTGMTAIERGAARMRPPVYVSRPLPCEVAGLDLEPSAEGVWQIPARGARGDPPVTVSAVELDHTVPTAGWVIEENPRPGTLDSARVKPLLVKHGVPLSKLRELKSGSPVTLPDGTVLEPADYVAASTQRKVCILSDMRGAKVNATLYDEIAKPTLLVHECTNAFLEDDPQQRSPREVERLAKQHGHSTPQMAGRLAKSVEAQHLALTHFSARYSGGLNAFDTNRMRRIGALAEREFTPRHRGRPGSTTNVTMAMDLMKLVVHIDGGVEVIAPDVSNSANTIWRDAHESRSATENHG